MKMNVEFKLDKELLDNLTGHDILHYSKSPGEGSVIVDAKDDKDALAKAQLRLPRGAELGKVNSPKLHDSTNVVKDILEGKKVKSILKETTEDIKDFKKGDKVQLIGINPDVMISPFDDPDIDDDSYIDKVGVITDIDLTNQADNPDDAYAVSVKFKDGNEGQFTEDDYLVKI